MCFPFSPEKGETHKHFDPHPFPGQSCEVVYVYWFFSPRNFSASFAHLSTGSLPSNQRALNPAKLAPREEEGMRKKSGHRFSAHFDQKSLHPRRATVNINPRPHHKGVFAEKGLVFSPPPPPTPSPLPPPSFSWGAVVVVLKIP